MKAEPGFESSDGTSYRGSPRIICAQRNAAASCVAYWPANAILRKGATLDLQSGNDSFLHSSRLWQARLTGQSQAPSAHGRRRRSMNVKLLDVELLN